MSSLESLLAVAGESTLLQSLDYSIPSTSSAVVSRKQHVRAYPTSGSTLSPTGTKTCRIRIGGDAFVDSSSVRLMFTISNKDGAKLLKPFGGPWCCFDSVRLLSQGVEIDNYPHYGRHHELFGWNLLPYQEQWGEAAVCGMGGSFVTTSDELSSNEPNVGRIPAGDGYTVIHKLHCSLFNQKKALPIRLMPLELELTLAQVADWIDTTSTYSQVYTIDNIQLMFDELILDESVSNSFYKSLLSNHALTIPYLGATQTTHIIPTGSTSLDLSATRAFSKLDSIWITFRNTSLAKNTTFMQPAIPATGTGQTPSLEDGVPKWCPTLRVSIAGMNIPDGQPAASIPEHYYMMCKALGYTPNLTRDKFTGDCFVMCCDLKRVIGDHGTAMSTRSGDNVRISLTGLNTAVANEVNITLFHYGIVALRESGVSVLN